MSEQTHLRPREHGAYAMLTFPILSGVVLGGFSWAGIAFAVLAVSGFLAHESVLVVLGSRGERIRSKAEPQARRALVRLGAVGLAAAAVFAATAPAAAWRAAILPAALAVAVAALLRARKTKSLLGELVVAAAFSSVHGVMAAAGGHGVLETFVPVAAWATCFILATLSVHALKYRFKNRGPGRWTVIASPVLAVAVGLAGLAGFDAATAALPKAAAVLALSVLPANPRHLKRIGWTFVVADALVLALLVWRVG